MWFILSIFGAGGELQISFYGKENEQQALQIDRNGEMNVPELDRWYLRD